MKIIFALCIALSLIALPWSVQPKEINSSLTENQELSSSKEITVPKPLTQKEIENLLGPEPYLGPTSWLDSQKNK